jgi:hypothetical protein
MFAVSSDPGNARKPISTPIPGRFIPSIYPHDFLKTPKMQMSRGANMISEGIIAEAKMPCNTHATMRYRAGFTIIQNTKKLATQATASERLVLPESGAPFAAKVGLITAASPAREIAIEAE